MYLKICSFLAPRIQQVLSTWAAEAEPKPFHDLESYRDWAKELLTYSGLRTGAKYL